MKTKLRYLWESMRSSIWFIPIVMVLLAIGLSLIMLAIDRNVSIRSYRFFELLYSGGPEGARSILSTIASSMITVTGVVFSITMVVLTLASSQFGPRLLRNFMDDRGNQIVLGTFIATFIYCLLILQNVKIEGEDIFTPTISVSFAIALATVNIGVLIYFIHHVSTSIQADRIIANVSDELEKNLQRLFPKLNEKQTEEKVKNGFEEKLELFMRELETQVSSKHSGYLRAISENTLFDIAIKNNLCLFIQYHPGEFVMAGSSLVKIVGGKSLDDGIIERIGGSII